MERVYLATFAPAFEGSFVPYSVGCLQAHAQTQPVIRRHYEFAPLLSERLPLADTIDEIECPAILGLSCYVWSHEYSLKVAERVKQRYPDCTVVLGGPDIPFHAEEYLRAHPFVDFIVHGEGEEAFSRVLERRLTGDDAPITGVSERRNDGSIRSAITVAKVMDLRALPSPYLANLFENFAARHRDAWFALAETNRGCPYECSFCYWGAATASKVRSFPIERTLGELEYFSSRHAAVVYSCDANFGMFELDEQYASRLSECRETEGFPLRFRPAYAKIPTERVFRVARTLHASQLEKGVTISLQSTAEAALSRSNRRALDLRLFSQWIGRFAEDGIPTYTELILGLPGETARSFAEGISAVLDQGQHDGLIVNLCLALPNTELAPRPDAANGVTRTARLRMDLAYSRPSPSDVTEYCDVVVETDTMTHEEWFESAILAYAVQGLHCTGLTKLAAIFAAHRCGVSYDQFFARLISDGPRSVTDALGDARAALQRWLSGGRLCVAIPGYGDTLWPPEDALFLKLIARKTAVLAELREWLQRQFDLPWELSRDLVAFTAAVTVGPDEPADVTVRSDVDWCRFLRAPREELVYGESVRTLSTRPWNTREEYALEIVRYGRKAGLLQRRPAYDDNGGGSLHPPSIFTSEYNS